MTYMIVTNHSNFSLRVGSYRRPLANLTIWITYVVCLVITRQCTTGVYLSMTFFSSAWLCQQSSWNRNLSVVCPCVRVAIIAEPTAQIFFTKFGCGFPWAIRCDFLRIFWRGALSRAVEHSTLDHWVPVRKPVYSCLGPFHPSCHCPAPSPSLIRPWMLSSDVK